MLWESRVIALKCVIDRSGEPTRKGSCSDQVHQATVGPDATSDLEPGGRKLSRLIALTRVILPAVRPTDQKSVGVFAFVEKQLPAGPMPDKESA